MTVRWKVRPLMKRRGWTNAHQLSIGAGLSYPVARRLLSEEPIDRIDVVTLEALSRTFDCQPWDLLEYKG